MYRSILVPLDGSAFGEQALPLALGIARRAGAKVQLAHVHLLPAPMYTEARPNFENTRDVRARGLAQDYLDGVVKRLGARVPVASVVLEGGIAEALQEHTIATGVDLVVMTTHGRGPLSRFWLGSVADEMVRRSPVPLLLVRPGEEAPDPGRDPVLRHLLIPLDGTALAEAILAPALALGGLMEAEYTLLRVVPPLPAAYDSIGFEVAAFDLPSREQMEEEARTYLELVACRLRGEGRRVRTRVVLDRPPAAGILDEAQGRPADLIALGTHGRRGLARLLLGSVADKVIRGALTPVLVHRPAGK
jgi:nucleotide-binding universal stress UspA family protein